MPGKHNAKFLDERKRQAIITSLADGESKRSIARRLNVSNNTVDAVAATDWQQVASRRERIAAQAELTVTKAFDQINEHLDQAKVPLNILVPVAGMATDKLIALRPQDPLQINVQRSIEPSRDVWSKLDDIAQALRAQLPAPTPAVETPLLADVQAKS